jgi:hypothetical protein
VAAALQQIAKEEANKQIGLVDGIAYYNFNYKSFGHLQKQRRPHNYAIVNPIERTIIAF